MRKKTALRERIYSEDLKKAAKKSVEEKLRDVLLLSEFCCLLKEKADTRTKKVT